MTDFDPPNLLRGPHVQSVLASGNFRRMRVQRAARRLLEKSHDEIADCGDGVRLLLHHTPPCQADQGRMVALIHGWEGSSNSTYILSAATHLWNEGYRVIRINLRDHGNSHHLNEELFHSCRLTEAIGAVKWIQSRFPDDELLLGGASLGGNFSLRIAANAISSGLRIRKVVAVCPVLDPAQTMDALDSGWFGYRQYFLRKWRRSLKLKQAAFPDVYDFTRLRRFKTLRSMTDFFVQNYTEIPNLESYLSGYAVTGNRLADLPVPASILVADDDPVIPVSDLSRIARSPMLSIDRSTFGGHCGFLGSYSLTSWLDSYFVQAFDFDSVVID